MMSSKTVIQNETHRTVDFQTGEVVQEVTSQILRFPQEPPYVKMYIQDLCALIGVTDSDQALLRHLLMRLDYEGYVALTARSRTAIAKALDITPKTLRNRLNRLVNADLIRREAQNEYLVNPHYFARGDWKSICEQRKTYMLRVVYSDNGRDIETGTSEQLETIDNERH